MEKCASDIIELVLYICGISNFFPKDVISCKSTYIEISTEHKENISDREKGMASIVNALIEKIDSQEKAIEELKRYVLNVETVLNGEILDLRQQAGLRDP